jgi:hypothetical protein
MYRQTASLYATGRAVGVTDQTVERCLRRARDLGVMAALDDSPRPGREPVITSEARTFVVNLACRKAKDLGYPHELWTTRLLTRHAREKGPAAGHACLANLAREPCARYWPLTKSGLTTCATICNAAPPSSRGKWPKFCASTAKSRC